MNASFGLARGFSLKRRTAKEENEVIAPEKALSI